MTAQRQAHITQFLPPYQGTNFLDKPADKTVPNAYYVRPLVIGKEKKARVAFILPVNNALEPVVRIPLHPGSTIKYAYVGDLNDNRG